MYFTINFKLVVMKFLDTELTNIKLETVIDIYKRNNLKLTKDKKIILKAIINNNDVAPTLRIRKNSINKMTFEQYLIKWDSRFDLGFNSRSSVKIGKVSNTYPDSIVKFIFNELSSKSKTGVDEAEQIHSLFMTIENLVGELLEEYLYEELKDYGWVWACGETLNKIDFCSSNGDFLQIKNSDNSENSASSSVRAGTSIKKWFRRFSTKYNTYNWSELREITQCNSLSEENFKKFVVHVLKNNSRIINI